MKTRLYPALLLLALALPALAAQEPKLHKELEQHRISIAKAFAKYTVSVDVDYDRDAEPVRRPGIQIPGLGQEDPNDPFTRYDVGPFTGLIVAEDMILISDRCLGDFNVKGAGKSVDAISVTLPNGDRFQASVLGRHQEMDLALLKIDGKVSDCPDCAIAALPKGDVVLERGQQVFVVGRGMNPFRVLLNDGVVSALERERGKAFQLDARVGNATLGAPVIDNGGNIVGLVSFHRHQEFGQSSGVSYAAYGHEARRALDLLKEGKFIERPKAPFMGVGATKKWEDKPGLEVGNVVPGGGAEKAGIRVGDIILAVDGVDMNDVPDLIAHIAGHKVGDVLTVKIQRGEETLEVKVTLGARV